MAVQQFALTGVGGTNLVAITGQAFKHPFFHERPNRILGFPILRKQPKVVFRVGGVGGAFPGFVKRLELKAADA